MGLDSCSCPLPSFDFMDDSAVLLGRVQLCTFYLFTLRCGWVAFAHRTAIRDEVCSGLQSMLVEVSLAFSSSSADPFARKVEEKGCFELAKRVFGLRAQLVSEAKCVTCSKHEDCRYLPTHQMLCQVSEDRMNSERVENSFDETSG